MLELPLLVTAVQVLRNDGLDADTVLSSERIVLAVALVIHVMCAHEPSDLCVFIHAFQFLALWIAIVLKGNWIVSESE